MLGRRVLFSPRLHRLRLQRVRQPLPRGDRARAAVLVPRGSKAVRLAREANRLAPSVVGSRAVVALERVRADLNCAFGRLPVRVPAVDIS